MKMRISAAVTTLTAANRKKVLLPKSLLDPLHGRYPNPDQSRGFEDAGSLPKLGADLLYFAAVYFAAVYFAAVYLRAANRLSAFGAHLSCPGQSSVYALLDDRALEFREHTEHLKQRSTSRRGRIHGLLFKIEVDTGSVQLAEKAYEVLQRSPKTIH